MSNIASGIVNLATIWPVVVFAVMAVAEEPPATMPANSYAVEVQNEAAPDARALAAAQSPVQAAPLLRETSQIVDVPAEIRRDQSGAWLAVIANPHSPDIPHTFTLMPGTRLAELQRLTESSPANAGEVHLSGQLYVYRDKNYLLPTHVTIVTAPAPSAASSATQPSSQPDQASTQSAAKSAESSAARVLRELDQAAGNRVTGAGSAADTKSPGKTDASHAKSIREGVVITNRRGKLSRDGAGAWVFVFDADAHGQSDPPMKILPCLLLERMEDYARRIGGHAPAILNGTVYLYRGQNFLLPTVFLIPQDRRNITP